jgi:lipopolysaccharide transport system ATP-binding protein
MTKAEIRRKFDEIVAFSEVESFIDTPVKRYSSGMYVRLAFAVAAHLDPEILIIDEVLAVGDAAFQQKCLGKMKSVSESGRTVLFVSHNINAIMALCTSALVMKAGTMAFSGDLRTALTHYGASTKVSATLDFTQKNERSVLRTMQIQQDAKPTEGLLEPFGEITLDMTLQTETSLAKPRLSVAFTNAKGDRIFAVGTWLGPRELPRLAAGTHRACIVFTMPPVVPGRYTLDIGFYDPPTSYAEEYYAAGAVEIAETNHLQMSEATASEIGQIYVRSKWSLE